MRFAVDPHLSADGALARGIQLLPERECQQHLVIASFFAFFFGEDAPPQRLHAQHAQERWPGDHRGDPLGIAARAARRPADRHTPRVVQRLLFEDVDFAQAVVIIGHPVRRALHAGPG